MQHFQAIAEQFEVYLNENLPFPEQPANLYEPCRYLLEAGGKRIRPVLCLMANELFGPVKEDAYHAALAIELFHNFTLAHDDIMDQAPLRRGKPAVHARFGLPAGILSGDVLNILAYEQLSRIRHEHAPAIFRMFNRMAIAVCEGQQLDMDYELIDKITVYEYLKMIELKTSVLLAFSLQAGAVLGGAGPEDAGYIYEFGKNLGLAFQLQDDYLDTFGSQDLIGKLPGGDIRANKKTFLYIKTQELAGNIESNILMELSKGDPEEKVERTREVYERLNIPGISQELIGYYSDLSFSFLNRLNKAEAAGPLEALACRLLNRKH